MKSKYDQYIEILKSAKNIAIFMHINPDCDCIGSAIALYLFMRKAGKNASFFSPDLTTVSMISDKYSFLPGFSDFNKVGSNEFDLAVAVDTGDAGRVGDIAYKKFSKIKNKMVIDHHAIHEDFAKNTLRESDSASTTQILYKVMRDYDESLIDSDIATLLYAGLVTDSGGFTFDNCTEETYLVASKLVSYNIKNGLICEKLLKDITKNVFTLKNKVLSEANFYDDGKIGIIVFTQKDFEETDTIEADTDGIINNIRDVSGVEIAISIAETGDKKYKVSFRTKNFVSAAACAKCFGGGGHVRAAGCRIYGYFEDVYNKLLNAAREMLYND